MAQSCRSLGPSGTRYTFVAPPRVGGALRGSKPRGAPAFRRFGLPSAQRRSRKRTPAAAYEPSPMDASLLAPQLAVLGVIGATGAYWWFVLVPSARVRLAANKKSGSLRRYLEELKAGEGRRVEKWFYANWLTKIDPETKYLLRNDTEDPGRSASPTTRLSDTGGVQDGSDGEDSLEEVLRKARRAPKFWSGDNPVLAGAAISILGAALFSALSGEGM